MALTAKERHARWLIGPGKKEARRAYQAGWRAKNQERIRELGRKPETVAKKKKHRQKPEVRAAACARNRRRLQDVSYRAAELLRSARGRSVRFGVPFGITVGDIEPLVSGACPHTGMPFDLTAPTKGLRKNPWSPSLDRVVPELGYVKGNIEIVSTWYNLAKNEWPPEVMRAAIEGLTKNFKNY